MIHMHTGLLLSLTVINIFLTAFLLSHSTSCQSSPRVNTAKGSEESTGGEG